MFEDSILESSPRWRTHRGWATLASSALQAAALTLMVLVPVLRPDALPLRLRAAIAPLPEPYSPVTRPSGPMHGGARPLVRGASAVIFQPIQIPTTTYSGPDLPRGASGPATVEGPEIGPGCPTCPPGISRDMSSVFGPAPAPPRPAPPKSVVVSGGVAEGYLVQQVQPAYPYLAKITGVQGDVVLQAMIGSDGRIEQLEAVSGHPLLVPAALDAVRRWRYRPYLLSGRPVEVETQITVRFTRTGR